MRDHSRTNSGERRQLAGTEFFGKLPKTTGWQAVLPSVLSAALNQ
jgi:hypothetical protein